MKDKWKEFDELWRANLPPLLRQKMLIKDFIERHFISKKEVFEILEDEIATAHTTTSGKTSRLASAYMRIKQLCKK